MFVNICVDIVFYWLENTDQTEAINYHIITIVTSMNCWFAG